MVAFGGDSRLKTEQKNWGETGPNENEMRKGKQIKQRSPGTHVNKWKSARVMAS